MKLKAKIALLLLAAVSVATAQTEGVRPDYKKIEKEIKEKKSDNYFPKLMARFVSRDTTMTEDNYRNLYFGYTFQKDYNPYSRNDKEDELRKYADLESLDKNDLKKAIALMDDIYKKDPFNLNVMNMQAYAYQVDGNVEMSKKVAATLSRVIDAILNTGNGETCETAFHVQSIPHEYLILSLFGLESVSQALVGHCDYLQFEKDKYKIAGLYFDISKMQESMMADFGK